MRFQESCDVIDIAMDGDPSIELAAMLRQHSLRYIAVFEILIVLLVKLLNTIYFFLSSMFNVQTFLLHVRELEIIHHRIFRLQFVHFEGRSNRLPKSRRLREVSFNRRRNLLISLFE